MKKNILLTHVAHFALILFWANFAHNHHAHAITVDLGSLPLTDASVSASNAHENYGPLQTIDGNLGGNAQLNGWLLTRQGLTSPQTIDWTWSHSPPALSEGERVDYYRYTINLHYGWHYTHTLKNFQLSTKSANSTDYVLTTNYESLSSADGYSMTNNNGMISSGRPTNENTVDTHTLIFRSSSIINSLRLSTPAYAGWEDGTYGSLGTFMIGEITGSIEAEVVPEPASLSLITGLFAITLTITLSPYRKQNKYL